MNYFYLQTEQWNEKEIIGYFKVAYLIRSWIRPRFLDSPGPKPFLYTIISPNALCYGRTLR